MTPHQTCWPHHTYVGITKKTTQNYKLLHQLIKLARRNNCYKLNKTLTFLNYTENRNTFKHFLKTDSEMTVDDDLVLKSNWIAVPSELQNHVILLVH